MRYAGRLAGLLTAAALLAACTGTPVSSGGGTAGPSGAPGAPVAVGGGTLNLLYDQTVTAWDPQRLAAGPLPAFALRAFARTLTGYRVDADGRPGALVGDLATDTGSSPDGGRTWAFTLRSGPAWEDGRSVTCADVRYGISRSFARSQLPGGLPYAVELLDLPTETDSRGAQVPTYRGPYTPDGQADFDSAVSCAGATLTLRLRAPEPDLPAILALPGFAAYRADHDRGAAGALDVFSCGPYRLESWETGAGGRFVRNAAWDPGTDPIRRAQPAAVDVREGIAAATIAQRLAEDKSPDDTAVSLTDLPSTVAGALADPAVAARVSSPPSGLVEFLQPNVRTGALSAPAVRVALATATDRAGFVAAYGQRAMTPAYAVLPTAVPGHPTANPLGVPDAGDPAAAKAALTAAAVTLPVPIRVAYRASAAADTAFAALAHGWEQAGFAVTLAPVTDSYYPTVSAPEAANRYEVFRASWYPDYPSGGAVLPALFDARVNLGSTGTGQDLGSVDDAAVNAAMDAADALTDPAARAAAWAGVDATLVRSGTSIPLGEHHRLLVRGSGVTAYADSLSLGGWPDLAAIAVSG